MSFANSLANIVLCSPVCLRHVHNPPPPPPCAPQRIPAAQLFTTFTLAHTCTCTSFKAVNPLIGDKPLGHPNKDIIIIIIVWLSWVTPLFFLAHRRKCSLLAQLGSSFHWTLVTGRCDGNQWYELMNERFTKEKKNLLSEFSMCGASCRPSRGTGLCRYLSFYGIDVCTLQEIKLPAGLDEQRNG